MENLKQLNQFMYENPEAWDRFMRFMERYGETNGLVFTKASYEKKLVIIQNANMIKMG